MNLKKINKLLAKSQKKLYANLNRPGVPRLHPLWKADWMIIEAIKIIEVCLSGENLK